MDRLDVLLLLVAEPLLMVEQIESVVEEKYRILLEKEKKKRGNLHC